MALLAGAHTWQCWRSSFPLSFCPLVASFSISFTLCFNQLSLQLCFNTIDIHLWVWDRGFGLCRRHCFLLFVCFSCQLGCQADHQQIIVPSFVLSMLWSMCRRKSVTGALRSGWGTWNASWRRRTRSCYGWVTAEALCQATFARQPLLHEHDSLRRLTTCWLSYHQWPNQCFTHSGL